MSDEIETKDLRVAFYTAGDEASKRLALERLEQGGVDAILPQASDPEKRAWRALMSGVAIAAELAERALRKGEIDSGLSMLGSAASVLAQVPPRVGRSGI